MIYLNGDRTSWQEAKLSPETLLGRNFVYTIINTYAHQPMHVALRLRYALNAYQALYGIRPSITAEEIENQVRGLLYYGIYPEHGNTLILYLLPNVEGECDTLLTHLASTPYDGYSLLSLRPKAAIANYEIPFEKYHTAVSLAAARFADDFAQRNGSGIALRANRAGSLISSGDNPIYALRGDVLLTSAIGKGARPSAERELMERVCAMAGIQIVESELRTDEIADYEEIIIFTPSGIQMVGSAGDMLLHSITAHRLEPHLKALTREGILR